MEISVSVLDAVDRDGAVKSLNELDINYIHIDVMDGKFVDNYQFQDIDEIGDICNISKYPIEVHLMVSDVFSYIDSFKNLGVNSIIFHIESSQDKDRLIERVREYGFRVGIAINPDTDIEMVIPYLDRVDLVLLMSVVPGKGGQSFIESTSLKLAYLRDYIDKNNLDVDIEVDGGINDKTIFLVGGANRVVVGSYIVKSNDYKSRIDSLR